VSSKARRNRGRERRSARGRQCPDCGAVVQDGSFRHAPTCPILIALEKVSADDGAYFEANPEATIRVREPVMAECTKLMLLQALELPDTGLPLTPAGYVTVTQVAPGVRCRDYSNVALIAARPEEPTQ
jgi:hypothetical protein